MLIENSRSIATILAARISVHDATVCDIATDAAQALVHLEQHATRYFVVVLDLDVPDLSDRPLLGRAQQAGIPVIALTGRIDAQRRDAMFAAGVADYVIKDNMVGIDYVARLVSRLLHNRGTKILLVDDSRAFRDYLGSLLQQHGYAVISACDGVEGLQALNDEPDIRLVITDYNMPRMNGLAMVSEIRKIRSHEELAIIGVSDSAGQDVLASFLKGGATDFLHKPFSVEELYCRVDQNIDMLRVIRNARDVANRDFLTRLYNRRYFFEHARRLHQRAKSGEMQLMLAVVDADHFKQINDNFGHQAGDQALVEMATVLRDRMDGRGLVARFGGEEFVCLHLLNCGAEPDECLEDLRRRIEAIDFRLDGARVPITASIGATTRLHASIDQMLSEADAAVYEAKRAGRNRVVIV
ncbi:MAG: diguanylate cyclase [Chromatiaceae bacterium]|nr:diguanylate cyclase [Chromatiaceae bacterium]